MVASHKIAVLSKDPVATNLSSSLMATLVTPWVCPWKTDRMVPLAASQRIAVWLARRSHNHNKELKAAKPNKSSQKAT